METTWNLERLGGSGVLRWQRSVGQPSRPPAFQGGRSIAGAASYAASCRTIARDRGLAVGSDAVAAYEISGRGNYLHEMQKHKVRQRVMVAVHRDAIEGKKHTPLKRVLVVHTQNSRVTGIFEYIQR